MKLLYVFLQPQQRSESQECKQRHAHANRHTTPSSAHAYTHAHSLAQSLSVISFSAGRALLPRWLLGHPGFARGATALQSQTSLLGSSGAGNPATLARLLSSSPGGSSAASSLRFGDAGPLGSGLGPALLTFPVWLELGSATGLLRSSTQEGTEASRQSPR